MTNVGKSHLYKHSQNGTVLVDTLNDWFIAQSMRINCTYLIHDQRKNGGSEKN